MDKYFIDCECGETYYLSCENIVVSDDAFNKMTEKIVSSNYKSVLIFYSLNDVCLLNMIEKELNIYNVNFSVINMPNCLAELDLIENLENKDQNLVVAIGSDEIISIAKYFSYCYENDLLIFPVGNFTDYTFSKYARIYDGFSFVFYETVAPKGIYVCCKTNGLNPLQTLYISSKILVLFEKEFNEHINKIIYCDKLKEYFYKTLNEYVDNSINTLNLNLLNIWTLIRLGQGMTFFSQTKYFFGAEKALTDVLQSCSLSADFLELNSFSQRVVQNTYSCFFKNIPKEFEFNMNKHIEKLSVIYNVSSSEVIKRFVKSDFVILTKQKKQVFYNYYYHFRKNLKDKIEKCFLITANTNLNENYISKYNFNSEQIKNLLAVCVDTYSVQTPMHTILSFGYLDKLFE